MRRWIGRGAAALVDQGFFAAANFVVSVMLARWLPPIEYGAFAVAFTIFLLIGATYYGLLSEPLAVYGSGKYRDRFQRYLGVVLLSWLSLSLVVGLLILGVGALLARAGIRGSGGIAVALVVAIPLVLLLRVLRMACYVVLKPYLAAGGSIVYFVAAVGAMGLSFHLQLLNSQLAFYILGLAALPGALILVVLLRARPPAGLRDPLISDAVGDHWRFGRWAVANNLLLWVPDNLYYIGLPTVVGLQGAAALRALRHFTTPVLHGAWAVTAVLVPALVQTRGTARFRRIVSRGIAGFGASTTLYAVGIAMFHKPLVSWLYQGSYDDYSSFLWWLAPLPVFVSVAALWGAGLRALERPRDVFIANALWAGATLTLGIVLLRVYGLSGAIVGLVTTALVSASAMSYMYHRAAAKDMEGKS
jgi:O-antigen/teichoic acid export membrane protein